MDVAKSIGRLPLDGDHALNPWDLFPRRVRSPREARSPLPRKPVADARRELEEAFERESPCGERVVYIHLPFCRTACSFCGYNREVGAEPERIASYCDALTRQLDTWASRPWTLGRPFSAVHFGGGTPTALPRDLLSRLLRTVLVSLPLTAGAEVTVESTISDIETGDLRALRAAGATRIAFGVQTFDTSLRRALGRRASARDVLARVAEARDVGFANVCIDLLYGLPGQDLEIWRADLDAASSSGATGVSAYPMVPFAASQFGRSLAAEGRTSFFDLEMEYAFFAAADRAFAERPGWARMSPVQYGDAIAGSAIYVSACGRGAEILALGAGAGGSVGRLSYLNSPKVDDYVRGWTCGDNWPATAAQGSSVHELAKRLHRLGETTRLARSAENPLPAFVEEIVGDLVELGLARAGADHVQLTPAGCFWAGNISELFSLAVRDHLGRP